MTIPEFETTYAVPLTCTACIHSLTTTLHTLPGISHISASLPSQTLSITGTAPPSTIITAIESTGRPAILRGSGAPNTSAVCILETFAPNTPTPVRGLVRMVQVAPGLTIVDLSVRGVRPGTYGASVRVAGDVSAGAESTGGLWGWVRGRKAAKGVLGTVEVREGGVGAVFLEKEVEVGEMIGRSVVVAPLGKGEEEVGEERAGSGRGFRREDPDTLVGVIARSAGAWDNDKTVCSCSGKTVWEERKEQSDRGML